MSEVTIEGKVIKVRGDKDGYYLCIEIDENGIEKSANTTNYYKLLLVENGNKVVHCAQEVKKDKDYYYVEILVPSKSPELLKSLESSQSICPLEIFSVIGKRIKIKFEFNCKNPSTPNETPIKKDKIVECEIYE